jgi:RNA recognition motif-containing protein
VDKQDTTIYVGNLPWKATEDDLTSLFAEFGQIRDVRIIQDPATGRSRGYGFVEFTVSGHVESAVTSLNGREFQGRPLMVSVARPKPARDA